MNAIVGLLGYTFCRVGDVIADVFLIGCPAAIFTFLGFARLTNIAEAIVVSLFCIMMACLSWVAGRVMHYIVSRT
jgi:hypothetical protein